MTSALVVIAIAALGLLNIVLMAVIDRKVQVMSPKMREMLLDPDTRSQLSEAIDLAADGKPAKVTHKGKTYRVECRGAVQFIG